MIIYGQGAIRCHPYVLDEIAAARDNNLHDFDHALFGHLGHVASNTLRSLWLGITNGRLSTAPTKMKLVVITNKLTGSVPTWRYFLMLPWGFRW